VRSSSFKERQRIACRPVFILDADRGLRSDRWYVKKRRSLDLCSAERSNALFPLGRSLRYVRIFRAHSAERRASFKRKIAIILKRTAKRSGREHVKNENGRKRKNELRRRRQAHMDGRAYHYLRSSHCGPSRI